MDSQKKEKDEPHSVQRWSLKRLLSRYLHLDLNKRADRNAYYLVAEVFWAAFLNAAASFNVAYALRLDASDQMVGYLSSIPSLFAIFLSIPVGQWVQRTKNKHRLLVTSLGVFRLGFVAIALVPWLNLFKVPDGTLVVILLILFAVTQRPMIIGFTPLMSSVLPVEKQAPVISARMQILSAVQSLCVFLFGIWLDKIIFPLNYQLMYFFAFGLSIISTLLIAKIERPEKENRPKPDATEKVSAKERIKKLLKVAKDNPIFVRYTINVLCMDFGMWVTSPLFSIYYVKTLGASDGWLGTMSSLHNVAAIVGYSLWRPIVKRVGAQKLLRYTALLRPIWPLAIALAPNLTFILGVGVVWGLLVPGIGLPSQSTFLQVMPPEAREEAQSLHSTIQNASMFISPLLGIAIAEAIGIPTTLLIFAGVRLIGSLMWTINPITTEKTKKTAVATGN